MSKSTSESRRRDMPPPKTGNSEAEVLRGFLDYLRSSIASKVEGAPEPEVRTSLVRSGTTMLGLINHLTNVERVTFLGDRVTNWPATFRAADTDSASDVLTRYRSTVKQANRVLDDCVDLSVPLPRVGSARPGPSLRWALTHMIEETGRHAGHVDILRELADGVTGR